MTVEIASGEMVSPPPRVSTPFFPAFLHVKAHVYSAPVPSGDLGTSPRTLGLSCGGRIRRKVVLRESPRTMNSRAPEFDSGAIPSKRLLLCLCGSPLRAFSDERRERESERERKRKKRIERRTRSSGNSLLLPLREEKKKVRKKTSRCEKVTSLCRRRSSLPSCPLSLVAALDDKRRSQLHDTHIHAQTTLSRTPLQTETASALSASAAPRTPASSAASPAPARALAASARTAASTSASAPRAGAYASASAWPTAARGRA